MKKLVSAILLIAIILVTNMVFAASIDVVVDAPSTIEEGTETLTMTISIQNFQDVEEGKTLGFQTTLEYSEDIFESVAVQGENGWEVTYEPSTGVIVGKTTNSQANVVIATLTFTLKDDVTAGTTDNILLNTFILTDDDAVNQTQNYNRQVSIVEATTPGEPDPEQPNGTTGGNQVGINNTTNNGTVAFTNTSNSANSTDNTIKSGNSLPKTGVTSTIIICLAVIVVAGIIFIVRSKTIKLK